MRYGTKDEIRSLKAMSQNEDSSTTPGLEDQGLEDLIASSYVASKFPDDREQDFIPSGLVNQIVTRNSITEELGTAEDDLISFILKSAKKLFTISLICGLNGPKLQKAMVYFKNSCAVDGRLPVDIPLDGTPHPWFPSTLWSKLRKTEFLKKQWMLLAPVFPAGFVKLKLKQEHIFPFTFVDKETKEGTFGAVYQVTIHEAHQEEPLRKANGELANVAIKELKASSQKGDATHKEWEAEAKALEETSSLEHPHVVQARAVISKATRHYFMFPWADGGCLRDLYEKCPQPQLEASLIKDIVQQIAGLADALWALHNYKGEGSYRHGDLKPENILIFGDSTKVGTWKIADMGLAKHHVAATAARGPTTTRHGTPYYEPPEAYLNTSAARSRLYDVWSMGCITLELIIWLLYGHKELVEFIRGMHDSVGNASPYWEYDKELKLARVHPRVATYIAKIKKEPECRKSTAICDLIQLVETKLLIVPLRQDNRTLQQHPSADAGIEDAAGDAAGVTLKVTLPDSDSEAPDSSVPNPTLGRFRATAKELHETLLEIQRHGEESETYLLAGQSRLRVTEPLSSTPLLLPQPTSLKTSSGNRQSTSRPPVQFERSQDLLRTPSSGVPTVRDIIRPLAVDNTIYPSLLTKWVPANLNW